MGEVYFGGSNFDSTSLDTSARVLVRVPGARKDYVTPTYATQVLPGHHVVMQLAGPQELAAVISRKVKEMFDDSIGDELLEVQLRIEELEQDVTALQESRASRALPFLRYTQGEGRVDYGVASRIREGQELRGQDINMIVAPVYAALSKKASANSTMKNSIRDYLRNGETDNETLRWLAIHVDPVFEKVADYRELREREGGIEQVDISALEEKLAEIIRAEGVSPEGTNIGGLNTNVYSILSSALGVEPAPGFYVEARHVKEGKKQGMLVNPVLYNPNERNVPEGFELMTTLELGQLVTLFDVSLSTMLASFASKNYDLFKPAASGDGKLDIYHGDLVRAVFPDGHMPSSLLYSDARLARYNFKETSEHIMEIMRENLGSVPEFVANEFSVPIDDIAMDRLIEIQMRLMQLLPFPVYEAVSIDGRFVDSVENAKRHRQRLSPEKRILLLRFESSERQFERDFATSFRKLFGIGSSTIDAAVSIFGEELGFLRKVVPEKYLKVN